jgi:hypothetical protein
MHEQTRPIEKTVLRIYICPCGFHASGRQHDQVDQTIQDHAAYTLCPQFAAKAMDVRVSA